MDAPWKMIESLKADRRLRSDAAILDELQSLSVLPPEDDEAWQDEHQWHAAYVFIAIADIAAERRLSAAIPLLLERSSFGDPGEMMRGLRHVLEAIVEPDYDMLTTCCIHAAVSKQPGARLWAVNELGVLRDARGLHTLEKALTDEFGEISRAACRSLSMIAQSNPTLHEIIIGTLVQFRENSIDVSDRRYADEAIADILQ